MSSKVSKVILLVASFVGFASLREFVSTLPILKISPSNFFLKAVDTFWALSLLLKWEYTLSIIFVSSCPVAIIMVSLGISLLHIIVMNVCLAVWVWTNSNKGFTCLPSLSSKVIGIFKPASSAIILNSAFRLELLGL